MGIVSVRKDAMLLSEMWDSVSVRLCKDVMFLRENWDVAILRVPKMSRYRENSGSWL